MWSYLRRGALLLVTLLAGCAAGPIEPRVDYNQAFDFTRVQKVALLPFEQTRPADIALTDDQAKLVTLSLAKELVNRGYQVVQSRGAADVWLTWHLVTRDNADLKGYNEVSLYSCWRCGPGVNSMGMPTFTEGTFIVDFVDPVSNQSVWRAAVDTHLKPREKTALDQDRREAAARQVLARFPPR
ncbi:DUF4136 domain-containing protein [Parahaliea mediterranea]|uniref:DUF4136 domain-containing protein n=1 Tax=Parahaliea mediterranea TaxID=651086 RepID=A0A939IHL3_9GAMM|nr:DUF4136 domain-containing protein [Parahaliea mediterranea]MBN7795614.1 DUF4136 domain-containing protein [Parahaliea mediterranea]